MKLVIDAAFPQARLLAVLAELRNSCPHTTISLADAVLSGAEEAITERHGGPRRHHARARAASSATG